MKTLPAFWLRRGPAAWLLLPLSVLFGALAAARRLLFRLRLRRSVRLSVPVVVVGNLFVGGTGKTPFVIWLCKALQDAGRRPGVITRGFGRKGDAPVYVQAASLPEEAGDEPVLIAQRTGVPVMAGRDRVAAGVALLSLHPEIDVLVSDDGLQHYALHRDCEIVLFDGRGAGNGWLLPAGPLREPLSRRRDFTVVNGADAVRVGTSAWRMRLIPQPLWRLSEPAERKPLSDFAHRAGVLASAGIGDPERFFRMLEAAGVQCERLPLPDHHDFADRPFARRSAEIILITEKDAVKCALDDHTRHDSRIWVVPVTASPEGPLITKILERLLGFPPA